MPLARQVENFGLTFEEAVALRRSIADIAAPSGPPPVKQRPQMQVPLLTGLGLREANVVLVQARLRLGAVTTVDSPLTAGSVVRQTPLAGAEVTFDTEVTVEQSSGLSVRLPEVIGLGLIEAGCVLRAAGVRSEPSVDGRPGPKAQVVALEPPAGTLITPLTPVTIQLAPKPTERYPRKR
jgi:beta-lactam-binding protein with PASTA domain